ncbi:hypothetical protein WMW72_10675 [Paenibacillus filicis]|uniref:Phage protein n=1 Tax=Paenibacillus filicis TaxID=669464 RepID=A0ABU9DJK6_9BACL
MDRIKYFDTQQDADKEASEFLGWNRVTVFQNDWGDWQIEADGGLLYEDGYIR